MKYYFHNQKPVFNIFSVQNDEIGYDLESIRELYKEHLKAEIYRIERELFEISFFSNEQFIDKFKDDTKNDKICEI